MSTAPDAGLIDALTTVVSRAAAAILAMRAQALNPRTKADQSPVTAADDASEAIILDGLARLMPGVPVVSEEAGARSATQARSGEVILVDPVDGTRELVAGRDEFTINLGLIRDARPVLGIVAAPALGLVWRTGAHGGAERFRLAAGAAADTATERMAIRSRSLPPDGAVAVVSRSHFDPNTAAFLMRLEARLGPIARLDSGSAIKLCRVAEGAADVYPRLAPTHQWDVAAGHAILAAAGGVVTNPDGTALRYDADSESRRVAGFIAWGDPTAAEALASV